MQLRKQAFAGPSRWQDPPAPHSASPVQPGRLRAALVTSAGGPPGSPWVAVEHHATTTSTNARALELARPGLVVVADHQSAGRGRMARAWDSPPGASLLLIGGVGYALRKLRQRRAR